MRKSKRVCRATVQVIANVDSTHHMDDIIHFGTVSTGLEWSNGRCVLALVYDVVDGPEAQATGTVHGSR